MVQNEAENSKTVNAQAIQYDASNPVAYCEILVRTLDPDRYYAARYAERELRELMLVLTAWQIELRQIIQQVSAPPLGEIRLQWWRDAYGEAISDKPVRAHPVVQAMAQICKYDLRSETVLAKDEAGTLLLSKAVETAITERGRLLYDAPFESCEDFFGWAIKAEGALAAYPLSSELDNGKERSRHDVLEKGFALLMMSRNGSRLAPGLDQRELKEFCLNQLRLLELSKTKIKSDEAPLWLPLGLISQYANRNNNRPIQLGRHLLYLKMIMTGKL